MANSRKQSEDRNSMRSDPDDFEDVVETVGPFIYLILVFK